MRAIYKRLKKTPCIKHAVFAFLLVCSNALIAQTDPHLLAFHAFETSYNAGKYAEIFQSFSPQMQNALPLSKAQRFFSDLMHQSGKIKNKAVIKEEIANTVVFKAQFENSILGVTITLDAKNRISGLLIKPYDDSVQNAKASHNQIENYPAKITDILFTYARALPEKGQISIALIQTGKVNYYGVIRESDSIKAIENQNKIFEIGSITKVFTATLLAQMVQENTIEL